MENDVEKIDLDRVDWKSSREFFESLGEALDKLDDKDESYNFTWVGKRKSIIEAGTPINKTLRPDVEASKDFENTKNMLIVGDNLDALKLLQESYLGKIKMIYIDPPYNTGHDFVYHDNFTIKKSDFSDASTDSDGNIIVSEDEYAENSKANGRFHSDWLSMIYPRLKLARNLLQDDGVIFVSIDDNEYANLKKVLDEVFGEDNHIGTICWQKKTQPSFLSKKISSIKEYILLYSRTQSDITTMGGYTDANKLIELINVSNSQAERTLPKENALIQNGNYTGILQSGYYGSENLKIELKNDVRVISGKPQEDLRMVGKFKWTQETINASVSEGATIHIKNVSSLRPTVERGDKKVGIKPVLDLFSKKLNDEIPTNTDATNEMKKMFGGVAILDYPKPVDLIKYLVRAICFDDKDATVVDFFAGSGTTGHAVMKLNSEDEGNRKYILIQLDEKTENDSEAKKAGYETIDQITAERLRRASDQFSSTEIDTGFRLLRIDSGNENADIRKPLNQIGQSDLFEAIDNVKKDRTPLDLLFGVVCVSALPFDLKLETRKIGENTVYLYGYLDEGTGLVACFDDNIPEETIKEIANLKALTAAFKDSSFADSAAKINLSEHFRIISPDTKVKVL